jgi:PhzF family phenazine biosynthesis protein
VETVVNLKLWQIDAFASKPLEGNPAAIVPLAQWLDVGLMQAIAAENNLAETAFFVKTGPGAYDLRWFTPASEVDLCGHATLASAWLLFNRLETALNEARFQTRSGELVVTRGAGGNLVMSLPPRQCGRADRRGAGRSAAERVAQKRLSDGGVGRCQDHPRPQRPRQYRAHPA